MIPSGLALLRGTCLLILAGVLTACGSSGDADGRADAGMRRALAPGGATSPVQPVSTAAGAPSGAPVSAVIGPAGGALSTPDGRLSISVPAGALTQATSLSIQPVSNPAPGSSGTGYRLGPEGVRFSRPVRLTMTYAAGDHEGSAASALGLAYRTAAGHWRWMPGPVVDEAAKTVSIETSHFSDWSLVKGFQLRPKSSSVRVGRTLGLAVSYCYPPQVAEDDPVPIGFDCDASDDDLAPLLPITSVREWAVNGVPGGTSITGTVAGGAANATYLAPASKPTPDTVAVSAEIPYGSGGKSLLVANVRITEAVPSYVGSVEVEIVDDASAYGFGTYTALRLRWNDIVLNRVENLPGDQATYEASPVQITVQGGSPGCDPYDLRVTWTARLTVYDAVRGGAGDPLAGKYGFNVDNADTGPYATTCTDYFGGRYPVSGTVGAALAGGVMVGGPPFGGPMWAPFKSYSNPEAITFDGALSYGFYPTATVNVRWTLNRAD